MKKLAFYTTLILFCCLLLRIEVKAQVEPELKAKKFENPQWKFIVMDAYKVEKSSRAKEIIASYFIKASQKAGTQVPTIIDLVSGEWDAMYIWDMKEGIEFLNWEVHPDNVKWMGALNDIAGGKDKAKALLDEFDSYVMRSYRYLGKVR